MKAEKTNPVNDIKTVVGGSGKGFSAGNILQREIDDSDLQIRQRKKLSAITQRKENKTGLPDNLKSGIENLSGMRMDNVQVHYNSAQPAQLNAHAFAQGNDIHVASGQEKHLPHEAWHVVQQRQGRVKPTMQLKRGVQVNDDRGLEKEADVMGARAIQTKENDSGIKQLRTVTGLPVAQADNGLRLLISHNTDLLNNDDLPALNELVYKIENSSGDWLDESDLVYLQRIFYHLSGGWKTKLEEVLYGLSLKHGTEAGIPETKVTFGPVTTHTYNGVPRASSMKAHPLTSNPGSHKGSDATQSKWGNYVEGHLLNHLLHGPADYKNLAPFSTSLNRTHHDNVEDSLKKMVYNEGRYFYYKVEVNPATAGDDDEYIPKSITCTVIELDQDDIKKARTGGYTQKITLTNDKSVVNVDNSFTDISSAPNVDSVKFNPFDSDDHTQKELTETWNDLYMPWTEEYGLKVWEVAGAFYEGLTKFEKDKNRSVNGPGKGNKFFVPKTNVKFGPTVRAIVADEGLANIATTMKAFPLSLRPGNTIGYEPAPDKWWSPYLKGHLLNHHLFGPASDQNLIPMTNSLNTRFLGDVEQPLKENVFEEGKVFSFEVKWTGEEEADPHDIFVMENGNFPQKLISEVQQYIPKSKDKENLNDKSYMEDFTNWKPKGSPDTSVLKNVKD